MDDTLSISKGTLPDQGRRPLLTSSAAGLVDSAKGQGNFGWSAPSGGTKGKAWRPMVPRATERGRVRRGLRCRSGPTFPWRGPSFARNATPLNKCPGNCERWFFCRRARRVKRTTGRWITSDFPTPPWSWESGGEGLVLLPIFSKLHQATGKRRLRSALYLHPTVEDRLGTHSRLSAGLLLAGKVPQRTGTAASSAVSEAVGGRIQRELAGITTFHAGMGH